MSGRAPSSTTPQFVWPATYCSLSAVFSSILRTICKHTQLGALDVCSQLQNSAWLLLGSEVSLVVLLMGAHHVMLLLLLLQVWFDDPRSLAAKYKVASDNNLAGIGFWNLDCLDYSSSEPLVQQQTADMWSAVQQAVRSWKVQGQPVLEQSAGSSEELR